MRYAPGHKAKTRARILGAAAKVFRRQGYHASGVDEVMDEAGLTAGGFYAHFDSKQALLAEALTHAAAELGAEGSTKLEGRSGRDWTDAFLARYLSASHCRNAEDGCPLVALISEVAHAGAAVKSKFETIVRSVSEQLAANARPAGSEATSERALAALALCIGGLGLARSVRDEGFAEQILEACRNQAGAILNGAPGVKAP
jgi:TetR/AcrR family transcriptional repressor of nem operon